jgi:hypothetical protein
MWADEDCILPVINTRNHLGVPGSTTTTSKTLLTMTLSDHPYEDHGTPKANQSISQKVLCLPGVSLTL